MSFEQEIQNKLFSHNSEKTFIDKILAKDDVDKIRKIIKKSVLCREDILEILYLLTGVESKLVNYGHQDRYIILKYFVWLREFVKIAEGLYDYESDLKRRAEDNEYHLSKETEKLLENCRRIIEHNIKFLVDLYLNIARTTLSLGGTGLLEILKNKFEFSYPNQNDINTPRPENQNKKMFMRGVRKND